MALARDRVPLTTDFVTAAATTGAAVTGMVVPLSIARTYHCKFFCPYTVAATATGLSISVVPIGVAGAATFFSSMLIGKSAVGTLQGGGVAVYAAAGATAGAAGVPTALTDTAQIAGGLAILEFQVVASVAGQSAQIEVIPEAAAAVTVKAGAYLEWELVV